MTKVVMHIDNRAVVFGLENMSMRGTSMDVLRRCLLLAANHDLQIEPRRIPMRENKLADALSRFDHTGIANLGPHLVDPTCSLPARRFLTFKEREYQRLQHTIFGMVCHQPEDKIIIPQDQALPYSATWQATGIRADPAFPHKQPG